MHAQSAGQNDYAVNVIYSVMTIRARTAVRIIIIAKKKPSKTAAVTTNASSYRSCTGGYAIVFYRPVWVSTV